MHLEHSLARPYVAWRQLLRYGQTREYVINS